MRSVYSFLLFSIGLINLASYRSRPGASYTDKAPLNSEQLQVYGDLIESLAKTNLKFISNRTFPLELSSVGKDAVCMQGLQIEGPGKSRRLIQSLSPDLLRGRSIHLVSEQEESAILKQRDADPAAPGSGMTKDPGVLALSEVAFDKSHRFAVLKYVFLCWVSL
jgi:hypothetical protein